MTLAQSLVAFALAGGLLTVTPGVDTLLVLRTATVEGRRPAAFAALGIGAGCLAWGAAVALGMAALFVAAPLLFDAVRWAGAAYLAWIGLGLLLRPRAALAIEADGGGTGGTALLWFGRGFVTNLLNPKVGIFYLSFLPQFVPPGHAAGGFIFLLAALHVLMGLIWFAGLIAATAPIAGLLARPATVRAMDRACGALFVGLGVKLALTR